MDSVLRRAVKRMEGRKLAAAGLRDREDARARERWETGAGTVRALLVGTVLEFDDVAETVDLFVGHMLEAMGEAPDRIPFLARGFVLDALLTGYVAGEEAASDAR
jgi:hypothetical protein